MTRMLLGALRLIVGLGVALFSIFAVTATALIFFTWQGSTLAWDSSGPYWPFAGIALACLLVSHLWLLLWHRLPRREWRSVRQWTPQRPPLTIAGGTPPMTAMMNTLN